MPLFGDTSDWDPVYVYVAAYMFCGSACLLLDDLGNAGGWIALGWAYWDERRMKVCDG